MKITADDMYADDRQEFVSRTHDLLERRVKLKQMMGAVSINDEGIIMEYLFQEEECIRIDVRNLIEWAERRIKVFKEETGRV